MASDTVTIELSREAAQRLLDTAPTAPPYRFQQELKQAIQTALEGSNGSE